MGVFIIPYLVVGTIVALCCIIDAHRNWEKLLDSVLDNDWFASFLSCIYVILGFSVWPIIIGYWLIRTMLANRPKQA